MSFLPYAPQGPSTWLTSFGGSSVLHGAAIFGVLSSSIAFLPEVSEIDVREPEFEITLEILDVDMIELDPVTDDPLIPPDAVALQPDDAPTETFDELADTLIPQEDDAEVVPDEQFAALEPEGLETPEPVEMTEPLEPLTEPEPAVEDTVLQAINPDELSIDDLSPLDNDVYSPLAEPVAPSAPVANVIAPDVVLVPDEIEEPQETDLAAVILPDEPSGSTTAAPEPEVITPEPTEEPTLGVDVVGSDGVIANPSPASLQLSALIQNIRAVDAPQCALALPRRLSDAEVGLSLIGADIATLDQYAQSITNGLNSAPAQTREAVDTRQCAVLDAIGLTADYPASRIGLAIEDTSLRTGDTLQTRILGAGGLFLNVLLIDDNGVVQDLSRFTQIDDGDVVVQAPVARAGESRETRQLLVVLGSPDAPVNLANQIGQSAQDVFSNLTENDLRQTVFGVASFTVD
ncbi:hypothetical protein [Nereida sp. MMG025]|uniref:hypothetical protein n=1 Tax=Nereida sp. MMG025 TaxID=2909981 RepID=UPI001F3E4B1C|nr:hypothetical protein [Nereida sp. MMG025]MCF6445754.1 hypothetical protein [Nereida sp. MMG025]